MYWYGHIHMHVTDPTAAMHAELLQVQYCDYLKPVLVERLVSLVDFVCNACNDRVS